MLGHILSSQEVSGSEVELPRLRGESDNHLADRTKGKCHKGSLRSPALDTSWQGRAGCWSSVNKPREKAEATCIDTASGGWDVVWAVAGSVCRIG